MPIPAPRRPSPSSTARRPRGWHHLPVSGEEKEALLARVPMFAGLSPEQIAGVADVAVPRTYDSGEIVFREGDRGDSCYIVRSGAVRVTRSPFPSRAITLAELRPGDVFGELAMFDGEVRSATVEALESTTALAILAGDMRRLLLAHPEMSARLLATVADRLRAANEQIARLSFQTVSGRVAAALLGQVEARQAEGADERDVLVAATQSDIAQLAGSSRESASRFLAELSARAS